LSFKFIDRVYLHAIGFGAMIARDERQRLLGGGKLSGFTEKKRSRPEPWP